MLERARILIARPETRLSLLIVLLFGILTTTGILDGLEVKTLDWRFRQRPPQAVDDRIVMLYISDDCLTQLGKWPWPRAFHARVLETLKKAGARTVLIDVLFQEPADREPGMDQAMIQAIRDLKRVVLPLHLMQVNTMNPDTGEVSSEMEMVGPFAALASAADQMGFINVDYRNLNPDGIIRRMPLTIRVGDQVYPSLALAAAATGLGKEFQVDGGGGGGLRLGGDPVPMKSFPTLEASGWWWNLMFRPAFLVNYQGEATSGVFPIVNYAELAAGNVDLSIFRDKIVLLGPCAVGLADIKLTPYGEMPGVLIHANVLQNLLKGNYLKPLPLLGQWLVLFGLGGLTLFFLLRLQGIQGIAAMVASLLLYGLLTFEFFLKGAVVLDVVGPIGLMIVQFTLVRFRQMYWSLEEAYDSLQERSIQLERSNQSLDQQVRDLSQLNEAGNRFASTLQMDTLGREILDLFQRLWSAPVGLIAQWDQESEQMQALKQVGADDEEARLMLYDPAVVRHLHALMEERRTILDPQGKWFTTYLPLLLGNRVWGVILLNSPDPEPRYRDRENFWATLSGLAATALDNARLYNLATVDMLTKLYVRRFFQIQIDQEFKRARRFHQTVSLIMTDIDHFKSFNDTYGHQQGDVVLREVASTVKKSLREIDVAARYGGEEFCVLLPQTNAEGAYVVAERIRRNVELLCVPRLNVPGEPLRVTISLGVTSFPEVPSENPDEMMKIADAALYVAKESGRNRSIMGEAGKTCKPTKTKGVEKSTP